MVGCRCYRGNCSNCSCSRNLCKCVQQIVGAIRRTCVNKHPLRVPPLLIEVSTEANSMADQRIIDALTALKGQMTLNQHTKVQVQQQLHDDLAAQASAIEHQQQAHQALIAQMAVSPARDPFPGAVDLIPTYSGLMNESLADWLSVLNRISVAEG